MQKSITFHELTLLEPRLLSLLAEAQAHHWDRGESFCTNTVFFSPNQHGYAMLKAGSGDYGMRDPLP